MKDAGLISEKVEREIRSGDDDIVLACGGRGWLYAAIGHAKVVDHGDRLTVVLWFQIIAVGMMRGSRSLKVLFSYRDEERRVK